jgi:hypothetical protein
MNIKLHDAISSPAGASGMAVMRAIVSGERDPPALLAPTRRVEHVFALEQALQNSVKKGAQDAESTSGAREASN